MRNIYIYIYVYMDGSIPTRVSTQFAVFESAARTVLLPWMKAALLEDAAAQQRFWYQYPPTLRVQPGRSQEFLGSWAGRW